MSTQSISAETVRELLDYDPDTGIFTWKGRARQWFVSDLAWKTWNTRFSGTEAGGKYAGYIGIRIFGKKYLAHRLAWLWINGEMPKQIDHVNRDRMDNRIKNLRIATQAQNAVNVPRKSANGFRGVTWHKRGKWQVRVRFCNRVHHIGYFDDIEEAARAYDAAAKRFHGEFAILNKPQVSSHRLPPIPVAASVQG